MTSAIKRFFTIPEDPKAPFLNRHVKWLKKFGLILPEDNLEKMKFVVFHFMMVLFIFTEYIDLYVVRSDILKVLQNIKYTMSSTVNVTKAMTFIVWKKHWKRIMNYVNEVNFERREAQDKISKDINGRVTKYCKVIAYSYLYLTRFTATMIILQPALQYCISSSHRENVKNNEEKYLEIANAWVPFSKETLAGYLAAMAYQTFGVYCSRGTLMSFDTNAISIMIFIRGEFELLRRDCQILFGTEDNPATKEETKALLRKCSERHNELVEYARLFDSCISPIMLLYVIVSSIMLCATVYQFEIETSAMQKFITAEYLIFGVAQLFLLCWHSNDVLYASHNLIKGPYESIWWTRSVSEKKDLLILTLQLNTILMFSAGPFTNITVATFISILKGAYSYYTLLSKSQQDSSED